MPIAELAKLANISEPTVNRFCTKIGCKGYPDFKLQLAQEISSGRYAWNENINPDDDIGNIIYKIVDAVKNSIDTIANTLDSNSINDLIEELIKCDSIAFFGVGASGPVALDAKQKFTRFGIPVLAETDYINQRILCSQLSERNVVIFISYTGRTREIIESAKIAHENGAITVGLTQNQSPLSKYCRFLLPSETTENTDVFTPTTSRINHLAILDIVATVMATRLGDSLKERIINLKSSLNQTRV